MTEAMESSLRVPAGLVPAIRGLGPEDREGDEVLKQQALGQSQLPGPVLYKHATKTST